MCHATRPASPFVNPHDPSHQQRDLLEGNLAGLLAGRTFTTPRPPPPGVPTTPRSDTGHCDQIFLGDTNYIFLHPRADRFFPPGQIKLDRFPEGFNFNFKSQ